MSSIVRVPADTLRGRRPVPTRRAVFERIEDFSVTATAEAQAASDALRMASQLCVQARPRPDLVAQAIAEVLPRLDLIAAAGRALTRTCEIEMTSADRA